MLTRIAGGTPTPLRLAYTGSCVGLGRRAATLQFARADDSPRDVYLSGRLMGSFKEAVTRGTLWGIRREARKPGSTFWLKGAMRHGEAAHQREPVR